MPPANHLRSDVTDDADVFSWEATAAALTLWGDASADWMAACYRYVSDYLSALMPVSDSLVADARNQHFFVSLTVDWNDFDYSTYSWMHFRFVWDCFRIYLPLNPPPSFAQILLEIIHIMYNMRIF